MKKVLFLGGATEIWRFTDFSEKWGERTGTVIVTTLR